MTERWAPVRGWEGRYEVSDQGNVRSLDHTVRNRYASYVRKGGPLKNHAKDGHGGHHQVRIGGRSGRWRTVHQLVLEAFVGPIPPGMEVRHLNGDPTDNRLENLAYGTHSENMRDRLAHGTDPHLKNTHCPHGHAYDEQNTLMRKIWPTERRYRICRTCTNAAKRRNYAARVQR